jgi:hypothetical protein
MLVCFSMLVYTLHYTTTLSIPTRAETASTGILASTYLAHIEPSYGHDGKDTRYTRTRDHRARLLEGGGPLDC